MKLEWQKASYRRYYAFVGGLTIEVRRVGDRDFGTMKWIPGEIFGRNHHGREHDGDGTFDDAKRQAVKLAKQYLAIAKAKMGAR